jgi:cytoskeleton protein RodZ
MNDMTQPPRDSAVATNAAAAGAADGAGFGARLAAERQRHGWSISDAAGRLRLNPKQVLALEAEDLAHLPALPFVRGFVRNYARELGIDATELLVQLNARVAPSAEAVVKGDLVASTIVRSAERERLSRTAVLVGAPLLLVALGVIGWFATRSIEAPPAAPVGAEVPAAAGGVAATSPAPATVPTTGAPGEVDAVPVAPATESELVDQTSPAAGKSAAASPAEPAATVNRGALRLTFNDESWVEIAQADGRILLSQLNEAGVERRVIGQPPFKVVIGNASAVVVEYRGKTIDLKPYTREQVARLTLD